MGGYLLLLLLLLLRSLRLCTFFCCCCCCCLVLLNPAFAAAAKPTDLVGSICKDTTNYTFCVESLYSDPRTPTADSYVLAYVSFDLAYLNATHTKVYIEMLLKNATAARHDPQLLQRLHRCDRCYEDAVTALAQALNDLDSETYSELAHFAGVAARQARDCEAATFQGGLGHFPLSRRNHDLRSLSMICVVISNLFTGS